MKIKVILVVIICFIIGFLAGYFVGGILGDDDDDGGSGSGSPYEPFIDPNNFVDYIDNKYLPYKPGTTLYYEGMSEDEKVEIKITVTNETRVVMGVRFIVVRDTEHIDGELEEDTHDWFAQDIYGNVWYFGEDSKEYEDGELSSTAGSWESGVDGALPGIIMFGNPLASVSYRQEYYKGEAEDMAEIIGLNETKTVSYGEFDNVLKTREWTPLEPDVEEHKYYAPGIGVIYEEAVKGDEEYVELIDIEEE
ncbi:MAG: hypothetical protein JSV49_01520 [Thermoplasmata archaeon]|nr:MAG: hypothetical protein JSV49_01520 [Thermoplasmata archaeon]